MKISFQKKDKDPTVAQGMRIPYAPARRRAAQWRWYLILLIVSSPLLFFLFKMVKSFVVVDASGIVSLERVAVNSMSTGVLETLLVETGQDVHRGDVLARLYDARLDGQKALLESELDAFRRPPALQDNAREQLILSRLKLAKEILTTRSQYLQNVAFLIGQGAATVAELDLARDRRNQAQMDYDQVRFERRMLQDDRSRPTPGMNMAAAESGRLQIMAKIKALEQEQSMLDQVAAYNGRILDVFAVQGQALSPGAPILLLGRSDKPSVVAYLAPKYIKYAQIGRYATVTLPDGQKLKARVRENANLTKRLPADLSSPIGSRDLMLLVNLELLTPLPDIQWVDGLPVSVRFHYLDAHQ
jgi:multidrug resistance efflux pump